MSILVTGGAGYIGSHATKRLLDEGHHVVVVDNLHRGHRFPIQRLAESPGARLNFVHADIADSETLKTVFSTHSIDTVMHFAALTYVGESVEQPLLYHHNNTAAALNLVRLCDAHGVERFVFSSTAATYGQPPQTHIPITEDCPTRPINPYGRSKLALEHILWDWAHAREASGEPVAVSALRYFNVAGCHRAGVLGEHHEPETHLIPVILQAALGKRDAITIFGDDYDTPDGTCIRDYVHVEDLVDAHLRVMDELRPGDRRTYNLGIGRGYSVREIIDAAREVTGVDFPVRIGTRRAGDPPVLHADAARIRKELGWQAQITDIREVVESAWHWFKANPRGYPNSGD